ncbi:MAG: DMT family transporter [Myxococcota bacterium]
MAGFDPKTPPAQRRRVVAVIVAALLGISSSAVLVKLMQATALAIATWRMVGAAVLVSVLAGGAMRQLRARHLPSVTLAGLALALHFWTWFASVQYTTVLRSTLLVSLVPVWTALLEGFRGAGWPTLRQLGGFVVALGGLAVIEGLSGPVVSSTVDPETAWMGDALATFAGMLWAIYLSVGRRVRQTLPVTVYFAVVCAVGAIALGGLSFALGRAEDLVAFDATTAGLIGLAILGPQLLGHQGFAYAIKWVDATTISLVMLLEPVGASLLALVVLAERPSAAAAAGALLIVAGVAFATIETPAEADGP